AISAATSARNAPSDRIVLPLPIKCFAREVIDRLSFIAAHLLQCESTYDVSLVRLDWGHHVSTTNPAAPLPPLRVRVPEGFAPLPPLPPDPGTVAASPTASGPTPGAPPP